MAIYCKYRNLNHICINTFISKSFFSSSHNLFQVKVYIVKIRIYSNCPQNLFKFGWSITHLISNENQVCLLIQDIKLLLYNCHQRVNRTIQSWKSLKVAILTQFFDSIEEDLELLCLITTRIFKYVWFFAISSLYFPILSKAFEGLQVYLRKSIPSAYKTLCYLLTVAKIRFILNCNQMVYRIFFHGGYSHLRTLLEL